MPREAGSGARERQEAPPNNRQCPPPLPLQPGPSGRCDLPSEGARLEALHEAGSFRGQMPTERPPYLLRPQTKAQLPSAVLQSIEQPTPHQWNTQAVDTQAQGWARRALPTEPGVMDGLRDTSADRGLLERHGLDVCSCSTLTVYHQIHSGELKNSARAALLGTGSTSAMDYGYCTNISHVTACLI